MVLVMFDSIITIHNMGVFLFLYILQCVKILLQFFRRYNTNGSLMKELIFLLCHRQVADVLVLISIFCFSQMIIFFSLGITEIFIMGHRHYPKNVYTHKSRKLSNRRMRKNKFADISITVDDCKLIK